jgi:hypothetical protein
MPLPGMNFPYSWLQLASGDKSEPPLIWPQQKHARCPIGDRLAERGSLYAVVFAAVLAIARLPGLSKTVRERVAAEPDRAALDKEWMDPEVTFGPRPEIAPVRFYRNGVAA